MAKSRKQVAALLTLLGLCLLINSCYGNVREPVEKRVHQSLMGQEDSAKFAHSLRKRSLRHHLSRRDAEDSFCREQEKTLESLRAKEPNFLRMNQFDNETKYSIAIAWVGENTGKLLVVTSEEVGHFVLPSTVYQSLDDGFHFKTINDRVQNALVHKSNGLQKDPHNPSRVYLIAYRKGSPFSDLYITEDGGDTFKYVPLSFSLQEQSITFYPDKSHSDVLFVHTGNNQLWISKDGGKTWTMIKDNVRHCKWGTNPAGDKPVLYAAINKNGQDSDNRLVRSTDFGVTWDVIKESVYTFGSQGKFLYASIKVPGSDSMRLMEVSTDEGQTWNEVQLPTITEDRFYSILDMTEGMIFMHVDSPTDNGQGTLYTSDSSGVIFSESLKHHFYPNFVDLTDFYKTPPDPQTLEERGVYYESRPLTHVDFDQPMVQSMRGVYLASQIDNDKSIHTMITFDRGGEWHPVRRPEGVACKNESKPCYLQIHNAYSKFRGIQVQPPLSIENAVGLIIVHAHVADALQTTPPDVFVTSDGGYTWVKALDGPHTVQIADHGGLLVAIPSVPNPKIIKFSTDEGRCWHSFNFTQEDIVVTGLLTEPGNRAMSVGIWGFGRTDRVWRVHVLNFTTIIKRQCDRSSDYENWVAHNDNTDDATFSGCLLGKKESMRRLKKDSLCANGYNYEVTKTEIICTCRVSDYECDYGYERTKSPSGENVCVEDPKFQNKRLDICTLGHEEEIVTKGYRKVPGDRCVGGFEPAGEKIIDLKVHCKNSKEIIIQETQKGKAAGGQNTTTNGLWVAVVMLVLLLALVTTVYFVRKYNLLRRGSGSYAYSSLTQNEDGLEDALLSSSLYDETADEVANTADPSNAPSNYSTMNSGAGAPASSANSANSQRPNINKYSVQPHLKNYQDDSDVDMLD